MLLISTTILSFWDEECNGWKLDAVSCVHVCEWMNCHKTMLQYAKFLLELCSYSDCGINIVCVVYKNFTISEKGDTKTKIEALKKTIHMIVSGERLPGLLMTIIRFVLPLQDHMIKKLLLIFWEIVPKTTPDGKLMQEMILVCDSYRKVWCSF